MNPVSPASSVGVVRFATTHWSAVLAAARTSSPDAEQALENLCLGYWYPLYAFLRRKGLDRPQAEDITQGFFADRVVTGRIFKGAHVSGGKFRTWLLNSLQNYLRNECERQRAQKRGGGRECLSLDFADAEGKYLLEPGHNETPERLYDRAWAIVLLDRALTRLRGQYAQNGREFWFDQLAQYLPGALASPPYHVTAGRLGKSEPAIKMAVSRLSREYGRVLREEIQYTLDPKGDAKEELHHLMAIVGE